MRTIKIERERWVTPHSVHGAKNILIDETGCGCIMGLIGQACGVPPNSMVGFGSLKDAELETIGIESIMQEIAININDDSAIRDCDRERKLKELFEDVFTLEFV